MRWSHYVGLTGLELAKQIILALNSQTFCACFLSPRIKGVCVITQAFSDFSKVENYVELLGTGSEAIWNIKGETLR